MKSVSFAFLLAVFTPAIFATSHFSPYQDITLNVSWDSKIQAIEPQDLATISAASGVKNFTLAFITASNTGDCSPTWGGYYPAVGNEQTAFGYDTIRAAAKNGLVTLSFGGAAGTYLSTCQNASALAATYQNIIKTYNVKNLDFDIEGDSLNNRDQTPNATMMQALHSIQSADPSIQISFTLPVLPTGLTPNGMALLQLAKDNNVKIAYVNIMAMDYGFNFSLDMLQNAKDAANASELQLKAIYPEKSDADLWQMIGITPMIGVNDQVDEIFSAENASDLVSFAKAQGVADIGMWSLNRDHPCVPASVDCSGAGVGNDYDFAKAFLGFEINKR